MGVRSYHKLAILRVYLVLRKILNPLGQIFNAVGKFFILVNVQTGGFQSYKVKFQHILRYQGTQVYTNLNLS